MYVVCIMGRTVINKDFFADERRVNAMANCSEMKKGDTFLCKSCGLELQVSKACSCESGAKGSCTVPLQCCGKEMTKK